jgi:hypothetical protein
MEDFWKTDIVGKEDLLLTKSPRIDFLREPNVDDSSGGDWTTLSTMLRE